jgi:hypothetical protein
MKYLLRRCKNMAKSNKVNGLLKYKLYFNSSSDNQVFASPRKLYKKT